MTDRALVEKRLATIVSAVSDLRRLAHLDALRHDVREERFIGHTLQLAVQAALDVASHIVSDESLGEPQTNRSCSTFLPAPDGSTATWPASCRAWPVSPTCSFTATTMSTWQWSRTSFETGSTTFSDLPWPSATDSDSAGPSPLVSSESNPRPRRCGWRHELPSGPNSIWHDLLARNLQDDDVTVVVFREKVAETATSRPPRSQKARRPSLSH